MYLVIVWQNVHCSWFRGEIVLDLRTYIVLCFKPRGHYMPLRSFMKYSWTSRLIDHQKRATHLHWVSRIHIRNSCQERSFGFGELLQTKLKGVYYGGKESSKLNETPAASFSSNLLSRWWRWIYARRVTELFPQMTRLGTPYLIVCLKLPKYLFFCTKARVLWCKFTKQVNLDRKSPHSWNDCASAVYTVEYLPWR